MSTDIQVTPTLLGSIDIFRHLSVDERASLMPLFKALSYPKDKLLIKLGEHSTDVFFIISGRLRITIYTNSGKEVAFQDMQAGQMFGELSAIDGKQRSTNVIALTDAVVTSISSDNFFNILSTHPSVNKQFLSYLTGLIRKLSDRIVEYSSLSVKSRVYAELLRLARKNPVSNNQVAISPAPTHVDIANRISTHREAVSREISELSKGGIIKRSEGKLIIQDIEQLEILLNKQTETSSISSII